MAQSAGKDAVLKVGDANGGTTDITLYLTSISGPSMDAQVAEVSTLGEDWKTYIRTQVDGGAISCEGIYEHVAGTTLMAIGTLSAQVFELYPQGTAAGNTKLSGSALMTSFEPNGDRDDAELFSAAWVVSGTITAGTAS